MTNSFCPQLTGFPMLKPVAVVQPISEALELSSNGDSLSWIVGAPPLADGKGTEEDERQFMVQLGNGDRLSVRYTDVGGDRTDDTPAELNKIQQWPGTDSADRPLVAMRESIVDAAVTENKQSVSVDNTSLMFFQPVPQFLPVSPISANVPVPDGGYLFVEESMNGTYQLTQYTSNKTDVTHDSLRSQVLNPLPDTQWAFSAKQKTNGLCTLKQPPVTTME